MRGVLLMVLLAAAACGGDRAGSGTLDVFAATSLTDAFTELAVAFEAVHDDVDVETNFAASSTLATQISEGAPADVFAAADLVTMQRLTAAGDPVVFATNRAEIIVAAGNPLDIGGASDLGDPSLVLVTCAPQVPCGRYAAEVLARAGVVVEPDSHEENVGAVVTKVVAGEADAGIVYSTDVARAGTRAAGVPIAPEHNVLAEYPIAVPSTAGDADVARAFVEFVTGPRGRAILAAHGFGLP